MPDIRQNENLCVKNEENVSYYSSKKICSWNCTSGSKIRINLFIWEGLCAGAYLRWLIYRHTQSNTSVKEKVGLFVAEPIRPGGGAYRWRNTIV